MWRRMTSTGGASLKDLAARQDRQDQLKQDQLSEPATPRTPRTPRTPKTPRVSLGASPPGRPSKVQVVQVVVESASAGKTGAPLDDEQIERPSLTRADLLGARPGHFDRTHSSKAGGVNKVVTIFLPGECAADAAPPRRGARPRGSITCASAAPARRVSLDVGVENRSALQRSSSSNSSEVYTPTAQSKYSPATPREKALEARLEALEAKLARASEAAAAAPGDGAAELAAAANAAAEAAGAAAAAAAAALEAPAHPAIAA
ncbi:hypothetical protein M885DRAFT_565236 [Pelagophyceae sp. CCMP2097]|nr:hypothetical protein M885DRAFT_565236 [Pelagophyceae sp. CCMP2097]